MPAAKPQSDLTSTSADSCLANLIWQLEEHYKDWGDSTGVTVPSGGAPSLSPQPKEPVLTVWLSEAQQGQWLTGPSLHSEEARHHNNFHLRAVTISR